jgi:hypothetical protein
LKKQVLITLITYLIGFIIFKFVFPSVFFPVLIFLPLIFLFINLGFYFGIIRYANVDIRKFTSRFILFLGIKILALLVFIVIYVYMNPQNAMPFLIVFFALYLINSVFVIIKVLKTLKRGAK